MPHFCTKLTPKTKAPLWLSACVCAVLSASPSHALESLSDAALSQKTGQDGMTVTINHGGTIGVDNIRLIDGDGIADDVNRSFNGLNHAAGMSLNNTANADMRFCTDNVTTCTTSNQVTTITIDTDGGAGANGAFLNANISTGIKAIIVPLNTISLVGGQTFDATTGHAAWAKDLDIISFKADAADVAAGSDTDGIYLNFNNAPLDANIQLGTQPQGHMLLMSGVSDLDINIGKMTLFSYGDGDDKVDTNPITNGNETSQMTTKVYVDNVSYGGVYADIDGTDGLVLGMPGKTTIGKISVSNTVFGTEGSTYDILDAQGNPIIDPTTNAKLQSLPNASIGNLTIDTVKIQNLKIGVTGM